MGRGIASKKNKAEKRKNKAEKREGNEKTVDKLREKFDERSEAAQMAQAANYNNANQTMIQMDFQQHLGVAMPSSKSSHYEYIVEEDDKVSPTDPYGNTIEPDSIATGAYEGDPLEQGDTPTSVSQVTATTFAKGCEEQRKIEAGASVTFADHLETLAS